MRWPSIKLADCATFISGGTPNKARPEYWGGDIPWVSSGEMSTQFIKDTALHITDAGLSAGSKLVPFGTTFAVVRGMSLAAEFRVSYATRPMAFNQDLKALASREGIDPYYLFSSLRAHAPAIRDLATEAAHGTKKLEMERLLAFRIAVPELEIQVRVAAFIRAYDDLIEANQRRIALLEEVVRVLYREWFVNLRFPGRATQCGAGSLPSGWVLGTVGSMASFVSRGITPKYDDAAPGLVINQKCIRGGRLTLTAARRQSREVNIERQLARGDVLVNSTGAGTLGRVAQVRAALPNCTVDTHVTIVRPDDPMCASYLGTALLEHEFILSTMGVGSTNQLELGRSDIKNISLTIPTIKIRREFHDLVWPIFVQSETLAKSNEILIEARNALLPKVMSGEVAV